MKNSPCLNTESSFNTESSWQILDIIDNVKEDDTSVFWKFIQLRRRELWLSQREFCTKYNIPLWSLRRWEQWQNKVIITKKIFQLIIVLVLTEENELKK